MSATSSPARVRGLGLIALAAVSWGTTGSVTTLLVTRAEATPLVVGAARALEARRGDGRALARGRRRLAVRRARRVHGRLPGDLLHRGHAGGNRRHRAGGDLLGADHDRGAGGGAARRASDAAPGAGARARRGRHRVVGGGARRGNDRAAAAQRRDPGTRRGTRLRALRRARQGCGGPDGAAAAGRAHLRRGCGAHGAGAGTPGAGRQLALGWPWLLYLGAVTTAGAYALYTAGLRHVPASAAGVASLLEPLTATLLGVILFGERLGVAGWAGAVLLLGALVLLVLAERR